MKRQLATRLTLLALATLAACDPTLRRVPPAVVSDPVYINPDIWLPCAAPSWTSVSTEQDVLTYVSSFSNALVDCNGKHQAALDVLRSSLNHTLPNPRPK